MGDKVSFLSCIYVQGSIISQKGRPDLLEMKMRELELCTNIRNNRKRGNWKTK
jgi:hypothetical protein